MSRPSSHADFNNFYQSYFKEIWALAYARLKDAAAAQDVAQETFLRLWQAWERKETIRNPLAWLKRVARNLAEDRARGDRRRRGTGGPNPLPDLQSREQAPSEPLETKEGDEELQKLRDLVNQALAKLSKDDRALFLSHFADGVSYRELVERTGRSKSAIGRLLPRLLAQLRKLVNALRNAASGPGAGSAN